MGNHRLLLLGQFFVTTVVLFLGQVSEIFVLVDAKKCKTAEMLGLQVLYSENIFGFTFVNYNYNKNRLIVSVVVFIMKYVRCNLDFCLNQEQ